VARLIRGRSVIRSPRRQTGWGGGPASAANGGGSTVFTTSSSQVGAVVSTPSIDGLTIVRVRGDFLFRLLTASAVSDGFFGAVGLALFNDTAIAIGITALNTPITDEGWDGWMWHHYFSCIATGQISAAGASVSGGQQDNVAAAVRIDVDTKAMRKIPVGMSLAVVVQVTVNDTANGQYHFNSRVLTKLP